MPTASLQLAPEAITTPAALQALQAEWEALWRAAGATPFQSPRWLLPWWKHVGEGTLAGIAVRSDEDGALVGFAPLYVYTDASGRRHLFPLGIATTDDLDALVAPGYEEAVLAAIASQLEATQGDWDVLEAPQLRAGAALARLPLPAGWRRELAAGEPNPVLQLQPAAIPGAMRQNVRTARNRAARSGRFTFETADASTLPRLFDAFVRLHASRWNERGETGVLAAPGVQAMHREAMPLLLAAGLLRLHALRLDGECVGVLYGLADGPHVPQRRCYYYQAGFDPAARAFSPGTLLIAHAIAQAEAEGAVAFDFLRGQEGYKYRWGALDQPMSVLRVAPR